MIPKSLLSDTIYIYKSRGRNSLGQEVVAEPIEESWYIEPENAIKMEKYVFETTKKLVGIGQPDSKLELNDVIDFNSTRFKCTYIQKINVRNKIHHVEAEFVSLM